MGGGDVKMLAMIGAFLGWKLVLVTLVFSSIAGALIGCGCDCVPPRGPEIRAALRDFPRARRADRIALRRTHRRLVCRVLWSRDSERVREAHLMTQIRLSPARADGHRRRCSPASSRSLSPSSLPRRATHRERGAAAGGRDGADGLGDGGRAQPPARAGARDEGAGRGLRAPERRDHREHDVRAARRGRGRPGPDA